ncbi:hypothetical protein DBV05_g7586 [Lasiodiplodia theobromae]|uniref:Alpha/beta hydrolase fold-3 domain-containing protein n=1 Tax=Lasiodiplodia theobromae TaxID=45133 RepID=A0A5N5D946_9PEZI|nr:hypothetical protein DBV05_g7586 [Lasiodiplodia theobromae]
MENSNWESLSEMDPDFKTFYDKVGPAAKLSDAADIPISTVRKMSTAFFTPVPGVNVPTTMEGVVKSQISIPVRDGSAIGAVVYQPAKLCSQGHGGPLIVAYHGGGWCMGAPASEEVNCVNAVQRFGAVCVSVDYRLAPEHPFPTPINDSWDALKWLAANASQLGADPSRGFIVHGESAGGNFAVILALLARDENLSPPLTGISASIPAVLAKEAVPERFKAEYLSLDQNKDAPGLDATALEYLIGIYNPERTSPLFSPFIWPTGHKGLPPTVIYVCGMDPLRDEALLYERLIRTEYEVRTKLVIYPGLPHAFWSFFPSLESSKKAVADVTEGFGWLLEC